MSEYLDTMAKLFRMIIIVNVLCCTCDSNNHDWILKRKRQLVTDETTLCRNEKCGIYSYSFISRRFSGLFHSRDEIKKNWSQFTSSRQNYLEKQGVNLRAEWPGDGDSCCPTKVQAFINMTMENIYGQKKIIVHMPPKYQFVPHGNCLEGGTCDGLCVVEPVIQTLLTYNTYRPALEFDQFVVPGYCSCKAS